MLSKIKWLLILVFVMCRPVLSLDDLYTVMVPLKSQSEEHQKAATDVALKQVLIRVTGQKLLTPTLSDLDEILLKSASYVTHYGFVNDSKNPAQQMLEVKFSEDSLLKLIAKFNLPLWDGKRPQIVAWIVIEKKNGFLGFLDQQEPLLHKSQERGIPLFFPELDLKEHKELPAALVSGWFRDDIKLASARYDADAILIGKISENDANQWLATWELLYEKNMFRMSEEGASKESLSLDVVDWVADRLSSFLAVSGEKQKDQQHWLQIEQIDGFDDYVQVLKYFSGLTIISKIQVARVYDKSLLLSVGGALNLKQLIRIMQLKDELEYIDTNSVDGQNIVRLSWEG